jgi:hypothetical protein
MPGSSGHLNPNKKLHYARGVIQEGATRLKHYKLYSITFRTIDRMAMVGGELLLMMHRG